MAVRLQEVHPALVHLPIGLLPAAIGADLVGRVTGSPGALEAGRRAIGLAAAGAAISAVTGLIAQEEVSVDGKTQDMLITHRNLNLAATVVTGLMATWRRRRLRPSVAYLGLGLAGIAAVTYTAYLGGKMVYEYGVGVKPAGGLAKGDAPALSGGQLGATSRAAAADLVHGVSHLAQELGRGELAPSLTARKRAREAASPPAPA